MRELKIGISGVRGVVGPAFCPELIIDFACAFGTWVEGGPVVLGRDTRRSSTMGHAAVVAGLLSGGCEVIDLGVAPTPLISYAVRELRAAGGLALTGSHNDARWNALKFLGPDGRQLNAQVGEELLDRYHSRDFLQADWAGLRPIAEAPEMVERYLEFVLAALDVEAIRRRELRVAVDFCNGTCGALAQQLLFDLGCTLLPLNEDPTGEFAHPPAPTRANMRQLAGLMRYLEADLGAAINVDGDRLGLVTAAAEPLSEEYVLPLAAAPRLARRPGPVVTNLSTSRMIDAVAAAAGQPVYRTPVGEGHVLDRGLAEEAVLAGEGSGGVAVLPQSMTFDALLTLGLVLEAMAGGASLAGLVGRLPRYPMRKGSVACPPDLLYRALDFFRERFDEAQPDVSDGIRVTWPDAWLHLRASNTEPLLRVIVEADTEARAEQLFGDVMALARRAAVGSQEV